METLAAYNRCIEALTWACCTLKVTIPTATLQEIAELIVAPMTGPWRFFHTPEHIFDVGGHSDPIEVLAALFHDLVYVQIDGSINFNLSFYICPFVKETQGRLWLRELKDLPNERLFKIACAIFDVSPGTVLNPCVGQNEFLSAWIAAKVLERWLSLRDLVQVMACIEATIPFRGLSSTGLSMSQRLYERLKQIDEQFALGFSLTELQEAVKKAVRVANRDVGSIAHSSSAHFLANTWTLLPETNHNLTPAGAYRIYDYRLALQKMERFINRLRPELVFQSFLDEPGPLMYHQLQQQVEHNLAIARLYLATKLVAIALIEALSLCIGVDVPLSTMMGEMYHSGVGGMRLERFLPMFLVPKHYPQDPLEEEVYRLLVQGRARLGSYTDLDHSPLAAFLVQSMGFKQILIQFGEVQRWFAGEMPVEQLLASFEPSTILAITHALVKLFDSRKQALVNFYPTIFLPNAKHHPTIPDRHDVAVE